MEKHAEHGISVLLQAPKDCENIEMETFITFTESSVSILNEREIQINGKGTPHQQHQQKSSFNLKQPQRQWSVLFSFYSTDFQNFRSPQREPCSASLKCVLFPQGLGSSFCFLVVFFRTSLPLNDA